jgi:phosphatidylserine decarboxylase
MSLAKSFSGILAPIHRAGWPFIAGFAAVTLAAGWLWAPLYWIGGLLTAWCTYFFRDPRRVTPLADGLVIAPADGRVSQLARAAPPPELELGDEPRQRISIFMNVFDCHVNRAPVAGRIRHMAYRPGLFLNAELDKASEDNERNGLVIEADGADFGVVQIAGLVARRIVPFVAVGQTIAAGERFGLIRFGSRVDVYLPPSHIPLVGEGQRTIAGETVIATRSGVQRAPAFRAE